MYAGALRADRSVNSTIRIVDCILMNNTAQANGGEGLGRQHACWLTGLCNGVCLLDENECCICIFKLLVCLDPIVLCNVVQCQTKTASASYYC